MKIFKCHICGNMVELIENGGGELVCCGEPMEDLVAKETDLGLEKHVPVATYHDNLLTVKVGSVEHPMSSDHYISTIIIKYEGQTARYDLKPSDSPSAQFLIPATAKQIEIYEYCNIHGLWKSTFNQ